MKHKFLFSVFVIFFILVFISLGSWQLIRLNWKNDLILEIENSLKNPPVELKQSKLENYSFYFPDTFAAGSECFPKKLSLFQDFNLKMVSKSNMNVSKDIVTLKSPQHNLHHQDQNKDHHLYEQHQCHIRLYNYHDHNNRFHQAG